MNKRVETTYGGKTCQRCPFDSYDGLLHEMCDLLCATYTPEEETPIQIEITLATAPTREELVQALKNLLFAYHNKDADCPHGFEAEAVADAEKILAQREADHD